MTDWKDALYEKIIAHLPPGSKPGDYIASLEVQAVKPRESQSDLYTPAIAELVAMAAAISANCEPCFKYHFNQARQLGVSVKNMQDAARTALSVKQAPAQAVAKLAERYLKGDFSAAPESDCCPGPGKTEKKSCCQ
jgi:AhpD family alkylhydroperoxidase